jgi:hypothetical protein
METVFPNRLVKLEYPPIHGWNVGITEPLWRRVIYAAQWECVQE